MGKGGQNYGKRETTRSNTQSNRVVFAAWAKDVGECEEELQVNRDLGLSPDEVEKRRQIYGWNELEKHEGQSIFSLILEQFNDTLVRILLVAAVISFVLALYDGDEGGEMAITAFVEPLVIFLILIVNAIVGVWQESNAEKALEALKEIQSQQATVFRNGKKYSSLPAKELVPGDIVELRVGDKVPADMRVLNLISSTLRVEQGSLTGESEAVSKTVKPVAEDSEIQGKKCMVFAGTTVVNGNCISVVTQTGMNTEIGKVHSQIHEASQSEEDTPLKKKLNEFGEVLTLLIGLICALVWLINVKYFLSWEYVDGWPTNFKFSFEKCTYYFEIAVALAVAAIPEGLPAVITTCLALGTRKMAQKNALVRKLPSVETLGCTTVICSDKTGTLTTNQMAVAKIVAMGPRVNAVRLFNVEGTTYNPCDGKIQDWPQGRMDTNLQTIAKIAAICNDASIEQTGNHYVASGMPTEAALKVLVEKMGLPDVLDSGSSSSRGDAQRCCKTWSRSACRIATLEFDRDRKSMGVIVRSNSGSTSLLVKGAVENLLERSSFIQLLDGSVVELDQNARDVILQSLHEMSSTALRVLGFAYKEDPSEFATYTGDEDHPAHDLLLDPAKYSSIESKLVFAGFAGLRDPPRKEVRQAIEDCRAAGIQVMVITGDNKNTAEAICREIGVFGPNEDISSKSLTGREFMDPHDQKSHLRQSGGLLFSRAEPRHKQEIVRLLKEDGEVVAMTGDGVNDAPALKLTDIGIAMGITGTKVAKEASDMVLADDNFSTIVAAVDEGRSINNNMKAFIRRRLLPKSSSWSEIPEELLRLIFECISDWSDLHPCLGVCPLWRSTARPVLSRIIASAFLLLINPEQKQEPCKFLDSSATTFCIKARMELANYTIHDSNRGWLLMHSLSQEYSLYNPITREIVQLPSPPNGPFSNLVYINPPPAEAELKVFRIHKFVMSTSPRDPDCVVCILSQHRNNLAFCKPASSDKSFKLITRARAGIYSDMIFYKGEFYAVNGFNELYVMKLLERDNQIVAVQEHRVVLTAIQSSGKARQFYLAEEPVSKELLLVEKVKLLYWDSAQRKDLKMISKTVSFRFFKLKYKYYYNSAAATAVWEEVVRRVVQWDHHALLLVSGGSMFVSTDDDQTCSYKPNCIYFVDEFYNSDPLNYLKVYDLKSNTVEPFNFNPSCYNSQRLASDGLCTWFRASAV